MDIRVSDQQIDDLSNLLEQLRISIANDPVSAGQLPEGIRQAYDRLDRAVWRLQATSLTTFDSQYEALAKELGEREKKAITWRASGYGIEVPTSVAEAISCALLHFVRNSLAHGIEPAAERKVAGKPVAAELRSSITVSSGSLVCTFSDDGRGPDLAKIRQRALAASLIHAKHAERFSPEEILDLIFKPGFSTQLGSVDALSGRGMGLNAVREAFQSVGGKVSARSVQPSGLELKAVVPLTVLGIEAIPAKIGTQVIWFPKNMSKETIAEWVPRLASAFKQKTPPMFGAAEFVYFRHLDPVWKRTGPAWLSAWFASCDEHVLACRKGVAGAAETEALPALLADAALVRNFVARSVAAQVSS